MEATGPPFYRAGLVGAYHPSSQMPPSRATAPVRPNNCISIFPLQTATSSSHEAADPEADEGDERDEPCEEHPSRVVQGPKMPPADEQDRHCATGHAIYRSWCSSCVQGRGRTKPHRQGEADGEEDVPVISWDYGFLNAKTRDEEIEAEKSGQREPCPGWPRSKISKSSMVFGTFQRL